MNTFQTGCVDNTQKCYYIPYKTETEMAEEGGELICDSGELHSCCTKKASGANDILPNDDPNYKKVKTVEQNGKIKEMKVCGCKSDDNTCLEKNCNGFRDITHFETCKLKTQAAQNILSASPSRVVTIKENDLYPDCYEQECNTFFDKYGFIIGTAAFSCCCLIILIIIGFMILK